MIEKRKISVMIVDESFFMRKLLREMLEADPDIEIVGEARDGSEAIAGCIRYQPDVITMDYDMPVMNGGEATRRILALEKIKKPAILMISAFTGKGAAVTLECLRAGAFSFVQKPSGELSLDINKAEQEILAKIHAAAHARIIEFPFLPERVTRKNYRGTENAKTLIIIGASTGGPPLVENILVNLPVEIKASIIVVQHMPRFFTETFTARLDKLAYIPVMQPKDGEKLVDGKVLLVPGDTDLSVEKSEELMDTNFVQLMGNESSDKPRPCIDVTMKSAAHNFAGRVIAVILSGMGEDGREGAVAVRKAGGYVIAQSPETAAVDSMTQEVIDAGVANEILSPDKIAHRLVTLTS
ncbi:MAG: chemotaxis-specific protein-glutamate methyltransferase CheB [bacterium]